MTYLPISPVNDTIMPTAYSPYKDLKLKCGLLVEQWKRYYPKVQYYMLDLVDVPAVDNIAGDIPHTVVDDLWGEAVPQSALLTKEWRQPHGDTQDAKILDATSAKKFKDPIEVNAQIEILERKRELTPYGINLERDLRFVIPTALLDEVGIEIAINDYFIWDGTRYEVVDWARENFWKNTNVFLFIVCYVKRMEVGS